MEKLILFSAAFDKRDPDPKKNYGIHGVELRMILKGELGAISFLLMTNWQLPHVQEKLNKDVKSILCKPLPADISYHSPVAKYADQEVSHDECPYLDGRPCYCDGSGLNAQYYYNALVAGGSDAFWQAMEAHYLQTFGELK